MDNKKPKRRTPVYHLIWTNVNDSVHHTSFDTKKDLVESVNKIADSDDCKVRYMFYGRELESKTKIEVI